MDTAYGEQYRILYRRHWWWRSRERLVVRELTRRSPAQGWRAALDIGCGDGLFFPRLHLLASHVEGVEPDAALVSTPERDDGHIHVRPLDDSFLPETPPDLIVMLDVLEHLADPLAALRHVHRISVPGALLLLTVPAFRWLWTTHDDLNHHFTRYTRAEVVSLLEGSGFALQEARYFFHWLVLPKLLVRGMEGVRGARPAPPRVPPLPVNQFLELVSRLEHRLLTPLRIPFGSSVVAVAVRR